ncbi:hypothetical protein AVEN_15174-1 [Araneus ventricosus]|uniref:Uncharacterized protein n=1 Tax=Araneus ventricosus TaxID=182803 RepID=A0A4Y2MT37_ARAVE|nr:hypothetical protein AVEN_15174-1 [Araneus ventricosus]
MQQNLKRIAGDNWGISQIHRWTLYKTVIERMLAHGSSSLVSKSNIQNEEETFFDSKAIPTPYTGSLSHHPNGSVINYTRHPTPTHAITVLSQVYVNLSPNNPSSPYHYSYTTARFGD